MAAPGRIEQSATKAIPERHANTLLFLAMVLTVAYGSFLVIKPFLAGLAWAAVLAIGVQPLFRRLRKRVPAGRAALLTTVAMALSFVAPTCYFVTRLATEFINLAARLAGADPSTRAQMMRTVEQYWLALQSRVPPLRDVNPLEYLNSAILRIGKELALAGGAIAGNVLSFIGMLLFVVLALFFFLRDGPLLVKWFRRLSPLEADVTDRLFEEIRMLIESSVAATLLIAIVQGMLGGIATAVLGLPAPLIWGVAFGFCSLVPLVGPALAWIPAVLFLVITGQQGKAVAMFLFSALIIGQSDNVLRPALVSGRSRLSFQVSILSVLGGVAAFGMLGLVLGPVLVVALIALLEVYLDGKGEPGSHSALLATAAAEPVESGNDPSCQA